MPDIQIIEKHLSSFLSDLKNLENHKNVTVREIEMDKDLLWILERGAYLLIQNLFDMLAHIISADFNEQWDHYSDIGDILLRNKIINDKEKNILQQMSGFRNRLSHEYLNLDPIVLADIINNRQNDFKRFMLIIKNYCRI